MLSLGRLEGTDRIEKRLRESNAKIKKRMEGTSAQT